MKNLRINNLKNINPGRLLRLTKIEIYLNIWTLHWSIRLLEREIHEEIENSRKKKFSREKVERKQREKSLYPSNEKIMIKIIRDHIKVTQYGLTMIDVIDFK